MKCASSISYQRREFCSTHLNSPAMKLGLLAYDVYSGTHRELTVGKFEVFGLLSHETLSAVCENQKDTEFNISIKK